MTLISEAWRQRFGGTARLYGQDALQRFADAHICVVGIGGVGSWAAEALARLPGVQVTRFDDEATGVLNLRMRGACAGCPSSSATLKAGVEQMMRHYVPEVTRVEQTL